MTIPRIPHLPKNEEEAQGTHPAYAPGWMWRSVIELIANHETACLDHCRRYAMA